MVRAVCPYCQLYLTMNSVTHTLRRAHSAPSLPVVLELFKPVTWFPPMWAFGCGAVSAGLPLAERGPTVLLGVLVAGPLVCAASQAVNDWYDRDVDRINEPHRPIPSGRIPGRWGLYLAIVWSLVSLAVAAGLGVVGFAATVAALLLAWAYSAPPFRLKRNGWIGNAAVGLSYEGLAWLTGAGVLLAPGRPTGSIILLAALYSAGAHGIMTLNDFKSIAGDRRSGIGSLPARLGPARAAQAACVIMLAPQFVVLGALLHWGRGGYALGLLLLVAAQLPLMRRLLQQPVARATWYSGVGVPLYVLGMLVSALALRAGVVP